METLVQNGLLAAGYSILAVWLLRDRLSGTLPFFFVGCCFAAAYNTFYDVAIEYRLVVSIALLVRILPPIESCWKVLHGRRDCQVALGGFFVVLFIRIASPEMITAGYLNTRLMVTASVMIICLMFSGFASERFSGHHQIQTIWMVFHLMMSISAPIYNSTWPRRMAARWIYVAATLCLMASYRFARNRLARRELVSAE